VRTRQDTSDEALRSAITHAGANVHVEDRATIGKTSDHHAHLPVMQNEPPGRYFALTMYDPTPKTLRAVLDTIETCAGIDGEVCPFQLELSVDLYPHVSFAASEALQTREQLVGIVQRHVWSACCAFDIPDGSAPREIDRRQIYWDGHKTGPRYLFSDAKARWDTDRDIKDDNIRRSILSGKAGNDLFLDATIYQGHGNGRKRVNAQHKTGDKRNKSKGTFLNLPDATRRARIEVTLTSLEALEKAGLWTLDDLRGYKFRSLVRDLLVFRLPTCDPHTEDVSRTIAHMKTRGIYGVELSQRAAYLENRSRTKPRPRNRDEDGRWLVDWPEMNDKVGRALDQLRRQWRKF